MTDHGRQLDADGPTEGTPRCKACGYVLIGLGTATRCPECGRGFDLLDPATYITFPPFMAWRFWMPGLALAAGVGILSMVALLYGVGSWGWSVWIGVPLMAGSVLGYRVRAKWSVLPLLILGLIIAMCVGLASLNVAGLFCGTVFAGIAFGPAVVGTLLGAGLRTVLKSTTFDQRSYLPILGLVAATVAAGALDRPPSGGLAIETISTRRVIHASPDRVWDSILFYEEVSHPPPFILRIGLVRPLYARGSARAVGDIKTCVYNNGRITKRISDAQPGRLLGFEVIQQEIGYERDVRLVGGSFALTPTPDGSTLVTLSTSYEPLLRPRLAWRWGEAWGVHTLHGHVLEGMRRRAEGLDATGLATNADRRGTHP